MSSRHLVGVAETMRRVGTTGKSLPADWGVVR